jgi:uncharacterized membrane protein YfcA
MPLPTLAQAALGTASGSVVGFSLGLVGGGGSILAVPALVYIVGVASAHVAIGTSAVAVAANAALGLSNHARHHNVRWPCGLAFAATGIIGAAIGAQFGRMVDGQRLLAAFAVMMVAVAVLMLRRRDPDADRRVRLNRENAPRLLASGFGVGALSGFFGIGGGFLIVPALVMATGMPTGQAIGTSLVAVSAFGLTTATSYATAGLVDWPLVALFILGGAAGSVFGSRAARHLATKRGVLTRLFAFLILAVAGYTLVRSLS